MAYIEVCKHGKLVARKPVSDQTAREGCVVRLGAGQEIRLSLGERASVGEHEVRVVADDVPDAAPLAPPGRSATPPGPGIAASRPIGRGRKLSYMVNCLLCLLGLASCAFVFVSWHRIGFDIIVLSLVAIVHVGGPCVSMRYTALRSGGVARVLTGLYSLVLLVTFAWSLTPAFWRSLRGMQLSAGPFTLAVLLLIFLGGVINLSTALRRPETGRTRRRRRWQQAPPRRAP